MMRAVTVGLAALFTLQLATAHMPAGTGSGTRDEPVDLGDPTVNSWALTGELKPKEVKYYKFSVSGATIGGEGSKDRFYMGLYVPGKGEPGFTFYVAFFGMPNQTECALWGDGWGRRSGSDDHAHEEEAHDLNSHAHEEKAHDHDSHDHDGLTNMPYRVTSSGTTWVMTGDVLPERVIGHHDTDGAHTHEGFDYHKREETLVFIASEKTDRPNKFESFSPTLFRPRGSCIADFPRGGEYRVAVWGDEDQTAPKKFSFGIGLAERDVFAPQNLMTFDYILFPIQTWNGWNGFVLILPMLLFAICAAAFLVFVQKTRPNHYGTSSGIATPFRAIVLVCSAIILGHFVMNVAILVWATSNAHAPGGELGFPLIMGIFLPLASGLTTLTMGIHAPAFYSASPSSANASICARVTVGLWGVLHLFVHCGYIIAPVFLIIAALLPASIADMGLLSAALDQTPAADDTKQPPAPGNHGPIEISAGNNMPMGMPGQMC